MVRQEMKGSFAKWQNTSRRLTRGGVGKRQTSREAPFVTTPTTITRGGGGGGGTRETSREVSIVRAGNSSFSSPLRETVNICELVSRFPPRRIFFRRRRRHTPLPLLLLLLFPPSRIIIGGE